jgi:hypothetical protein
MNEKMERIMIGRNIIPVSGKKAYEREITSHFVAVERFCECGGQIQFNGLTSDIIGLGSTFRHKCDKCNEVFYWDKMYPHLKHSDPPPPQPESEYNGVEGWVPSLKSTIRECIDCGCLVAGGPTRCRRCVEEPLASVLAKGDTP